MRIGLIGIPGTGKSELAEAVRGQLDENDDNFPVIIDGYVPRLSVELGDVELTQRASYMANFLVAAEREKVEQRYRSENTSFITCGTIVDTVGYSAAFTENLAKLVQRDKSDLLVNQLNKEMANVMLLMYMPQDIFPTYNKMFYLPIPKKYELVLPGSTPLSPDLRFVDEKIQEYMEKVNLPHVVLDGTLEENTEKVLECFKQSELAASSSDSTSSDSQ